MNNTNNTNNASPISLPCRNLAQAANIALILECWGYQAIVDTDSKGRAIVLCYTDSDTVDAAVSQDECCGNVVG